MKFNVFILFSIFTVLLNAQTKVFKGAWFDIQYPASFTEVCTLKSISSDGCESALFKSSDGLVEFYIFSSQWKAAYSDIALKSTDKQTQSKIVYKGTKTIKFWTIVDKSGEYTRSYQEIADESTNWVVGIKYKNQAAYTKYKNQYIAFKKSLKQYAD